MKPEAWFSHDFLKRKVSEVGAAKSLRQWAEEFEMAPGPLSEILSGKRAMSLKVAQNIAVKAKGWTAKERKDFLRPFNKTLVRTQTELRHLKPIAKSHKFKKVKDESYAMIAEWEHFAILNLLDLIDFQPSTKWVAERLGLSEKRVEEACERLERLQFLKRTSKLWKRGTRPLSTLDDISSEAIKQSHRGYLKHIENALEFVDPKDREISGIVLAMDSTLLPTAKKIIRDFQEKMMDLLEQRGRQDQLAYLGVQLIPVGVSSQEQRNSQ